jgi:hypothetical protein
MMILLKSILTGLGAAMLVACVVGLWAQGVRYSAAMSAPGDSHYVDFHWHPVPVLFTLVAAFALGFWSQYRKAP